MRVDQALGKGSRTSITPARAWRAGLALAAAVASGCAQPEHYVLVHGAWMGRWVWGPVVHLLRDQGDRVTVVDLPAHGQDRTPVSGATLEAYVDRVGHAVDADDAPVVLVGHSMAGMVISQYAERSPEKVKALVYLAAMLPANGQSLMDLAAMDEGSVAAPHLVVNAEIGTGALPRDKLPELMCSDCSESAAALLRANYRDEPMAPLTTPVSLTEAGWGSVPRRYIFTAGDVVISPGLQQRMASSVTLAGSETLATAHTPQLSAPELLVGALRRLSR